MDRIAKAFQFFCFSFLAQISNLLSRVNKWNRHFCVLEKLSVCKPHQEKKTLSVLQRKEIPLSLSTVFFFHRFYSTIHSNKKKSILFHNSFNVLFTESKLYSFNEIFFFSICFGIFFFHFLHLCRAISSTKM